MCCTWFFFIRLSHWGCKMVDGAEFWTSCQPVVRKAKGGFFQKVRWKTNRTFWKKATFSCWQLIQKFSVIYHLWMSMWHPNWLGLCTIKKSINESRDLQKCDTFYLRTGSCFSLSRLLLACNGQLIWILAKYILTYTVTASKTQLLAMNSIFLAKLKWNKKIYVMYHEQVK